MLLKNCAAFCCEVLEGIVRDGMIEYLYTNQFICKHQHWFVKKKACVTNLLACLQRETNCLNKGGLMDILLKDFSKAFDKIAKKKLLLN